MLTQKVDLVIRGLRFNGVEMEGLTGLEISALAGRVEEAMNEVAAKSKIVDSAKLAVLAALDMAAKLQEAEAKSKDKALVDERKLEGMIVSLEKALEPPPKK